MTQVLRKIFSPLDIGSTTVKNRLMVAAHSHDIWKYDPEGYHRWNMYSERSMRYYEERAKGGFGLITMGQVMVHPSCGTNRPAGYLDEVVDAYRPMPEAIHNHGAKVFVQINHNGRGRISGTDDWDPVLTAKPDFSFYPGASGEFTKEIDTEEIEEIVKGFGKTARNMQLAGFDGVEIHAAHSYLLSEFLTPAYNRRTDKYGGSLENRMRFLMEAIDEVRAQVGKEFVVGIRLNTEWRQPDGFPLEDSLEVARQTVATGKIDFIDTTAWGWELSMSGIGSPLGPVVPQASIIKQAIPNTVVMVVGRIIDPAQAEQVVADGHADMVAVVRASIADPEFAKKAEEGREEDIFTCVGASQGCIGRHFLHFPITCTQNPAAGREAEWGIGTLKPTKAPKDVLVVGGGPAGLETALTAARRGHKVTILEKSAAIGGQINLIVKSPRRTEFASVIRNRKTQLDKLGVEVRLHTEVNSELVRQLNPDIIVVATGSIPRMDSVADMPGYHSVSTYPGLGISGVNQPHVFNPWDVMNGAIKQHSHVVIMDALGYHQSSDPLEYLLAQGTRVTALSTLGVFASDILYNDRTSFIESIRGKDVAFHQFSTIKEIGPDFVITQDHQTGREGKVTDVDAVVLSMGSVPVNSLYYELKGEVSALYRVGDCVTPRKIEHAHFDGHKLAREL